MRIAAIVQARMSSQRLPGKVLREVGGRPLLEYTLQRLEGCTRLRDVLVCTSDEPDDAPLVEFCTARGTACLRGPLNDVAARFAAAAREYRLDAFVRICGDSPWIDPVLVDHAVEVFTLTGVELLTNKFPRTYPAGQTVEVLDARGFQRACAHMTTATQREHVTTIFYDAPEHFSLRNLAAVRDDQDVNLAVDTPADLALFERVVAGLADEPTRCSLSTVVEHYRVALQQPVGEGLR